MDKAVIYYWMGDTLINKYPHNSYIDKKDMFKVAEEIFNLGFNVMIYQTKIKGDKTNYFPVIYIDTQRFQQR